MTTQPEALRHADKLDAHEFDEPHGAAAELRRLHEENRALTDALFQTQEAAKALLAQRDALLEAIKPMIDLAEFWINHGQKRHMCEQEFKVWLALGHESDAMRNARAAIKAVEENT